MTSPVRGDVAIIGMSCLYPGAGNVQQFWENILNKVDSVSDAPDDWYPELFCDPTSGADDRSYTKRGGFLKELAEFDPVEYGVMPNSIDGASPDHFLAIRVASEALEDAGYANPARMDPFRERTAVILGHGGYVNRGHSSVIQRWVAVDAAIQILKQLHPEHTDEELSLVRKELRASLPPLNTDVLPGLVPNIVSGRIANRLNLMGPTFCVDGACASSFLALDIACRELLSGRCDMALAGGVHASNSSPILIIFSQMGGLSRKGEIRPFDSEADGTLLSEGAGCLVLKRREDAERDGDRIYAVIKGMGVSSDGRAMGLLAPRLEGEELAIRRAYEASGVDPATVELIEGHGTATLVGDATELEVLNRIFGARSGQLPRCALGSVKSMIGHSIPASGMASIIKMALSLYHKVLPPTLHCEKPNAKLQSESSNLYINSETRAWIHPSRDTVRRAAVNAFGFGGVNSHAVLEEHTQEAPQTLVHQHWDSELFVLTAADSAGLVEETRALANFVAEFPAELSMKDLAWSLGTKPCAAARLAIVATSRDDLAAKLEKSAQRLADPKAVNIRQADGIYYFRRQLAPEGKLAFVFPGEGAQYTNMLGDLSLHFPEVREVFDLADRAYLGHPRGYFPSELLAPPPMSSAPERLWSMDLGSEAVLFANCAMFELLRNLGVEAGMMVGHSTGEHTALRFAEAVPSADENELVQSVRSVNSIFEDLKSDNQISERTLLAIGGADHGRLEALVAASQGRLYLAIDNCPNQVVLCGESAAIDQVLRELSSTPAICQKLPFARGYHTPWFSLFSERLHNYYQGTRVAKPRVPLYSCATAELFPDDAGEIRKTAASGWSRTVRFREVIEKMYQDGARIFLEVGPRGNLKSFIDDILRGKPYLAVASNVQHRSGILQLHHMLAMLFAHGVPLRLEHLYQRRDPRPIELKKAGRPKTRIKLGIEPMRLPPGFALPLRKQPAAAAAASPMVASGATNGHPAQTNGHTAPSRGALRQPAVVFAPPAVNARAAVLEQHFATMQQFLAVQQQVMGGALASRSGAPAVFSTSLPLPAPPAQPKSAQRRALPLISEVLELVPGVRARSIYRVAMEPIFEHHSFGRDISDEDPDLTGLAIIPLTVSVEILAEAAAVLVPGKVVVEMRDMRSQRWVMLDPPPFAVLEMTAEQVEHGIVHVKMRDADEAKAIRPTWMEVTVVFSDEYPAAPAPLPFDLKSPKPSKWTEGTLYPWGMFHGPLLRGVIRVDRTGTNGSTGTLEILRHDLLLSGKPDLEFVLDPVTLDAVGQMISFWSQEQVDSICDTLPYRFDSVQYFAPMPAAGTRMEGRVMVREVGERDIHCDLEVLDPAGAVLYRVKDWTDRRFPQPPDLWHFRVSPRDTVISKPAPELLGGDQPGSLCVRLDRFPLGFLDASFGIWGKMLAALMLSRSEKAQWQSLNATGAQRAEWLFLRCAAKDAVRLLVAQSRGVSLCPADISVQIDSQGRAQVSGGWVTRLGVVPIVAAAYSGEQAVAVASLNPGDHAGIALEQIASTSGADVIAEQEQALFTRLPGEASAEWRVRMACAKRALHNAIPGGPNAHLLRVTGLQPDSGKVEVAWPDSVNKFAAHTSRRDGYICATCVGPSGGTP